jgi:hypothetical protein
LNVECANFFEILAQHFWIQLMLSIRLKLVLSKKRIDQGHLHPKLEVPELSCPGWELKLGFHGERRAI